MRRRIERHLADAVGPLFAFLARLVPTRRSSIVVRSQAVSDDQAAQTIAALGRAGLQATWLVSDMTGTAKLHEVGPIRRVGSLRGLLAYLRAGTVLHTHGISFGPERRDTRRVFVNLWHGMPLKRLESDTKIARFQTDVSFATSSLHQRNLAETWGAHATIHETGLPRNDVLLRTPTSQARAASGGRPLIVWLPTFREVLSVYRHTGNRMNAMDGTDYGNVAQLPGASAMRLEALAKSLDATVLIKPHPMAAGAVPDHPGEYLHYVSQRWLDDRGVTLYELLAAADVLVTDYSSAWIDYLLTDRPIVFTAADREVYEQSRGFYPDAVQSLPGPVVTDVDGLSDALAEALADPAAWAQQRAAALARHHRHRDAGSADRVAAVVRDLVCARSESSDGRATVRSFDVFDTVLTRRVGDPNSVFALVAARVAGTTIPAPRTPAFVQARTSAERTLRRSLGRHATLLEIYREVALRLSFDIAVANEWAETEEQVERELSVPVPGAGALVSAARGRGEVVFVSDSPHREDFLLELLCSAGIATADDRVFASAPRGTSKSDGGLFETVRAAVAPGAAFEHIGDNRRSDVAAARSEGWHGSWRPNAQLNRYEQILESYAVATGGAASWLAGSSRLARLEADADPEVDLARDVVSVAAGVLGPALVGFALWVAAQARQRGIRRLYFVARDGQVMLEAARRVLSVVASDIECRYLYGSRQTWVFGATALEPDMLASWVTVKPEFTPRAMLARVGLDPALAYSLAGSELLHPDQLDRVLAVPERQALRELLEHGPLAGHVHASARAAAELAVDYLRQEGVIDPAERGALVDAGWTGATARAVDVLVRAGGGLQVDHLFMGMTRSADDPRTAHAVRLTPWLFDGWAASESLREVVNVNVLVEMLCAGSHGRTTGYRRSDTGRVEPEFAESNSPPVSWGLLPMQAVALRTAELAAEHLTPDDAYLDWASPTRALFRQFWMRPTARRGGRLGRLPVGGRGVAPVPPDRRARDDPRRAVTTSARRSVVAPEQHLAGRVCSTEPAAVARCVAGPAVARRQPRAAEADTATHPPRTQPAAALNT